MTTPMAQMTSMIGERLKEFFHKMEVKHKIPEGEMFRAWTELPTDGVDKPKEKKSNYQVFFSIQRSLIMKQSSNISFGEVSKRVSAMWKQMPAEEKSRYTIENYPPQQKIQEVVKKDKVTAPLKDEGVRIIHSDASVAGRSKVEITAEEEDDDDKDEEDFFFNEEEDSHNDDDCDIIDEDDNTTGDNQEAFDDDDD